MRRSHGKPDWQKQICQERIEILFAEADNAFPKRKDLADRYVELARRIAMKYKVRLGRKFKSKFCRHCHKYLRPGVNSRVRINSKKKCVVVTCLACGKPMRYPYAKEKKARRQES